MIHRREQKKAKQRCLSHRASNTNFVEHTSISQHNTIRRCDIQLRDVIADLYILCCTLNATRTLLQKKICSQIQSDAIYMCPLYE